MRFSLAYGRVNRFLLGILALGQGRSGVTVDGASVVVRMGWAFRARFPVEAIQAVEANQPMPFLGWGVHGWKGRWLVNGTSKSLVRLDLEPAQPARMTGWPIQLRQLWISIEDQDGLVAALTRPAGGGAATRSG
jgi:hypothetical protein